MNILAWTFSLTVITEVEKFVTANTQELAKDKWLCPISGKKFKGPEFVRKHIFNKHAEKVEEVKQEVSDYVPWRVKWLFSLNEPVHEIMVLIT